MGKIPSLLASIGITAMFATSAMAEDVKLSGPEIMTALAGHTYKSVEDGHSSEQIFQSAGATYYSVDGAQSQGRWEVRGGQYCSQWPPNESWSCYDVLRNDAGIVFVSASGKRVEMMPAD